MDDLYARMKTSWMDGWMDGWLDGWKFFLQLTRVLLYLDVSLVSLSFKEGKPRIVHLFNLAQSPSFHENNEGDCLSSWKEGIYIIDYPPKKPRNSTMDGWVDGWTDG